MTVKISNSYNFGDPNYRDVSLLLHGNGVNGSTRILDSSENPKIVTAVGNAQISTVQSRFGGASVYFDGTGDYLLVSSQLLNSVTWTIEAWVRPSLVTLDRTLFSQYNTTDANRTILGIQAGKLRIFNGAQGSNLGSGTIVADTWNHVAFVRNGTTVTGFLNGVQDVQKTNFAGPLAANTYIGAYDAAGFPDAFIGYMDEIRVTANVARYTANFTPPTAPFPDFYAPPVDPNYNNVSLLLHGDGANGSTTITDSSGSPKTLTAYGTAQISTAQSKFGGASIAFDGSPGSALLGPSNNNAFRVQAGSPLTIEAFVRPSGNVLNQAIFAYYYYIDGGVEQGYVLRLTATGQLQFRNPNGTTFSTTQTLPLNTWSHVAFSSDGSTCFLFIDGTPSTSFSLGSTSYTNAQVGVGGRRSDNTEDVNNISTVFNGYIDELRVTSAQRYVTAFTPPTAPFPNPKKTNALGGDLVYQITDSGVTYRVHEFKTVGTSTLSVTSGGEFEYLVVGGGGGGAGGSSGGGGGGGGKLEGSTILLPGAYSVAIGDGGEAGPATAPFTALPGGNSTFNGLTAIGGGRGGDSYLGENLDGGCGGGSSTGGQAGRPLYTPAGSGTAGQGYGGGRGFKDTSGAPLPAGGGGGTAAAGGDGTTAGGGFGGAGLLSTITGSPVYYGGGGGGGGQGFGTPGTGGVGGGGNGSITGDGSNGTNGLGGGGGGCGYNYSTSTAGAGGRGGSGTVIVRYRIS
jgi:hypothetical protein